MRLYSWLMLGGVALGAVFWLRLVRRDGRLFWVYLAALGGAFIGAKLVYLLAEGWLHFGAPDMWLQWATGKSILGGLLGGYAAVEVAKAMVHYPGMTGDWFALVAPAGIALGRVGCWAEGCCRGISCSEAWYTLADRGGVARWPSAPVELLFNLVALASFILLRRCGVLRGQHFHLYLVGYGLFRFAHEFLRDEPRLIAGLSGYHFAALIVFGLGAVGFARRKRGCVVTQGTLDALSKNEYEKC